MKETIEVCVECEGEVKQHFSGDEGWGICEECEIVEGGTKEIETYNLNEASKVLKTLASEMIKSIKEL